MTSIIIPSHTQRDTWIHQGLKLRPNQEKIVQYFVQGRDVFVGLPTGSEKSLCYCILPTVFVMFSLSEFI